jgi:hypothetical protein
LPIIDAYVVARLRVDPACPDFSELNQAVNLLYQT